MQGLLRLCRAIDAFSERIGKLILWLVLAATLISAGNAIVRKTFSVSSNAWLEIQWYLFGAVFLLGAGYTLLKNEHVRIDVLAQRFSQRGRVWIDILGHAVFVLPLCAWVIHNSIPMVVTAITTGEMSSNAGGLIRWPSYILMPIGFFLLALQSFSELVKRVAFLRGLAPDPAKQAEERSAEERLADEIRRNASQGERT